MRRTAVTLRGRFRLTHRGPGGAVLWSVGLPNGVTTQGADYLTAVTFGRAVPSSDWRLGLISDSGFVGVAASDTHDSHPGWVEFAVHPTRSLWPAGTPAGGVLANPAPAPALVPAAGVVRGVFLANRFTVGSVDPAGTLYATAVAAAGLPVVAGGTISITYGVTAQAGP